MARRRQILARRVRHGRINHSQSKLPNTFCPRPSLHSNFLPPFLVRRLRFLHYLLFHLFVTFRLCNIYLRASVALWFVILLDFVVRLRPLDFPTRIIMIELNYLPRLPHNKSPGIGCIGDRFIMADCQLVAYRQAGFNPVAICSHDPQKAQAVAARHQIPKAHNTYQELLADERVEVVDIAVPPDIQIDVVRRSRQAQEPTFGPCWLKSRSAATMRKLWKSCGCVKMPASCWP